MSQPSKEHLADSTADMDAIFFQLIAGGAVLGDVLRAHGPYLTDWPNGKRLIGFGPEGNDEVLSPYAVAAIGACVVKASAGDTGSAAELRDLADTGVVDATLRSSGMRSALMHIRTPGEGQVASLAIAANLSDERARPSLAAAFADPAALVGIESGDRQRPGATGNELYYDNGERVCTDAQKSLTAYNDGGDNMQALLARTYYNLLTRSAERSPATAATTMRAWLPLFRAACESLGDQLEDLLPADIVDYYDATPPRRRSNTGPADKGVGTVDPLQLPRRRSVGGPVRPGGPDTLTSVRQRDEKITAILTRYAECVDTRDAVLAGLRNVLDNYPFLAASYQRNAQRATEHFRQLLQGPDALTGQGIHDGLRAAVMRAAAEAHGKVDRYGIPELGAAAKEYLQKYLTWFMWRDISELPPEEILERSGFCLNKIEEYFAINEGSETPPFLVQLAAQIVTNNKDSVLPRGSLEPPRTPLAEWKRRLSLMEKRYFTHPSANPGNAEKNKHREHKDLVERHAQLATAQSNAKEIDKFAHYLRPYLERRFGVILPEPQNIGLTVDNPGGRHKLFRALAACAQGDAQQILSAPRQAQLRFVQQAGPHFACISPDQAAHILPRSAHPYYKLWQKLSAQLPPSSEAEPLPFLTIARNVAKRFKRD